MASPLPTWSSHLSCLPLAMRCLPTENGKANPLTYFGKVLKRPSSFCSGYLMYWAPFYSMDGCRQPPPHSHFGDACLWCARKRIALCYFVASPDPFPCRAGALGLVRHFSFSATGASSMLWRLHPGGQCRSETGPVPHGETTFTWATGFIPRPRKVWLSTPPAIVNVIAGYLFGASSARRDQL